MTRAAPLRDLARRPLPAVEPAPERCDVCAEPVPGDHRHLFDPAADTVVCACRACALLFSGQPPAGGTGPAGERAGRGPRYRLIPQRRQRLDGTLDDLTWAALGVPVTLAFFVPGMPPDLDGVTACYPGPLGTTRAAVPPDAWDRLVHRHPPLAGLAPGTEALLVDRAEQRRAQWIVPLDDCYRLVALLRTRWRGFGGGAEAQELVGNFLTGLTPDEA